MRIVLLGAPGAGKGTQARKLEKDFGLVQLSTGDLLRAAVAAGTDAGKAADAVMKAGDLVSDEIVINILRDRMRDADCAKGVILDGFPRTSVQAEALDELLAESGQQIDAAISLEVDDSAMVTRVAGRYTCAGCGEGYHDSFKQPAVAGVCDGCGSTNMKRRADDNAETVAGRLSAYHAQTAPLISYYESKGALQRVDAMGEIVPFCNAATAGTIHANRVDLINICKCVELFGQVADFLDRAKIPIHGIDRLKRNQLGSSRVVR